MAEFDDVRRQLRDARAGAASIDRALAATRQRLKRIAGRQADLSRVSTPNDDDDRHRETRERLARDKAAAEAEQRRLRASRDEAIRAEAGLRVDFAAFTDPRKGIQQLDDRTPILLMPVRLETRFKTVAVPGAAAPAPQLWVRIYPDDCWIDTFNPAVTANETRNTRDYWANVWQAGGIEAQEREAWRALVGSHGSGRAAYLVQQDPPANVSEKPVTAHPEDLVLVIVTDLTAVLPAVEAAAAATFWRAAWLADGNATAVGAAQAALDAAVTPARAEVILTRYQPVNFAARPATGRTRASLDVAVAFLVFEAPLPGAVADDTGAAATTESAWADAPKLTLLPDRFVFLGYQGGDPPVVVAGGAGARHAVRRTGSVGGSGRPDAARRRGPPRRPGSAAVALGLRPRRSRGHGAAGPARPPPRRSAASIACWSRPAPERGRGVGAARGRDAAPAPRLDPYRPESRAAGHADQQHRGRQRRARPRGRRRRVVRRSPDDGVHALDGSARQARRPVAGRVPRPRAGLLRSTSTMRG